MRHRNLIVAATLCLVIDGAAVASPAQATSPTTFVPAGDTFLFKPRTLDRGEFASYRNITWSTWGKKQAVGRASFYLSTRYIGRVTLRLDRPRLCRTLFMFSRARVSGLEFNEPDFPRYSSSYFLGCPVE